MGHVGARTNSKEPVDDLRVASDTKYCEEEICCTWMTLEERKVKRIWAWFGTDSLLHQMSAPDRKKIGFRNIRDKSVVTRLGETVLVR